MATPARQRSKPSTSGSPFPCRVPIRGERQFPQFDAGGWMQIEHCLQAFCMQVFEVLPGIAEELFVPNVTGPAEAVAGLIDLVLCFKLLATDVPVRLQMSNLHER